MDFPPVSTQGRSGHADPPGDLRRGGERVRSLSDAGPRTFAIVAIGLPAAILVSSISSRSQSIAGFVGSPRG
jgi:hypothetical protein